MWNVIGYLPSYGDLENLIRKVNQFLKYKGLFIFDCFNGLAIVKQGARKIYKARLIEDTGEWIYRDGIPKVDLMNQTFNMKYHYTLKKDSNIIEEFDEEHKMKFYYPQEMKRYLEDIGFEVLEITNVTDGNPATEDDWDIRYICKRI